MFRLCERATGSMSSRSRSFVTELRKTRWSFFVLQLPNTEYEETAQMTSLTLISQIPDIAENGVEFLKSLLKRKKKSKTKNSVIPHMR